MRLTPMSSPSAHAVSVTPTTRPRRSKGTWSAIHEPSPTSNTILVIASTNSPTPNMTTPALAPAITAPHPIPVSPVTIDHRLGTRSTIRPISGDDSPHNSLTANATPSSLSSTSSPRAIVARNGGANR
jgi:hypothetical protein